MMVKVGKIQNKPLVYIIFLDIDGVLNSEYYFKHKHIPGTKPLDHDLVRRFYHFCNYLSFFGEVRIVLSSTWRFNIINSYKKSNIDTVAKFEALMQNKGFPNFKLCGTTGERMGSRGAEVDAWLRSKSFKSYVCKYICIDNYSDFYPYQPVIKTSNKWGFKNKQALNGLRFLTNNYGMDIVPWMAYIKEED